MAEYMVEEWKPDHPGWVALMQAVAQSGQHDWFEFAADWHTGNHVLVALVEGQPAGFLRFVTQPIGVEDDHDLIVFRGKVLTEAKILSFWVDPQQRRQGLGRALQKAALDAARRLGCYQVRSFSDGEHLENHALKLAMGFTIHAAVRNGDTRCLYFLMPLRQPLEETEDGDAAG